MFLSQTWHDACSTLLSPLPSTREQTWRTKKCRVIVAKTTVRLCGVSPREGARGLCKLVLHLGTRETLVRIHSSPNSEGKCEFRARACKWGWARLSCFQVGISDEVNPGFLFERHSSWSDDKIKQQVRHIPVWQFVSLPWQVGDSGLIDTN